MTDWSYDLFVAAYERETSVPDDVSEDGVQPGDLVALFTEFDTDTRLLPDQSEVMTWLMSLPAETPIRAWLTDVESVISPSGQSFAIA